MNAKAPYFALSAVLFLGVGLGLGAGELGLKEGFKASVVLKDLNNPSGLSFDAEGRLTVCDSGNGRVILVDKDGKASDYLTGFTTEFWKPNKFKVGPLSAVWIGKILAVTDAGLKDGQETVNFYDKAGTAADAIGKTNAIGPTTQDEKDLGEGNFTGMSLADDGNTLYVCSHGFDAKTWVQVCDVKAKKLSTLISADENGIVANSPMQVLARPDGKAWVLYSGAGGKEDGLLVEWDTKTRKPTHQWKLPGLIDPMSMALIPGKTDELAVVDNNWNLDKVQAGKLAWVKVAADKDTAEIKVIGDSLQGPVACAFGNDHKLYIAQLGPEFDKNKGEVIAVEGFGK